MEEIDIWIPSFRFELAEEAKKSLLPYNAKIYNGSNYESFSKLINHCIINSNNETIIICSDKIRANAEQVDKILTLLNEGFALVGLHRFGFLGFKKDLIRKIGFMDERYLGGGYDDNDFIIRTKEYNLAHYMTEEVSCIDMLTSWKYEEINSPARKHFFEKWEFDLPKFIYRRLPEEDYLYKYNIGNYHNIDFLTFDKSIMCKYSNEEWIDAQVKME